MQQTIVQNSRLIFEKYFDPKETISPNDVLSDGVRSLFFLMMKKKKRSIFPHFVNIYRAHGLKSHGRML